MIVKGAFISQSIRLLLDTKDLVKHFTGLNLFPWEINLKILTLSGHIAVGRKSIRWYF